MSGSNRIKGGATDKAFQMLQECKGYLKAHYVVLGEKRKLNKLFIFMTEQME